MVTDSSSGTLPSSSRLTLYSSPSMARSKDSCLTSGWVVSAMFGSGCLHSVASAPHQRRDVGGRRLRQGFEVVAAFEHGDEAALRALVGHRHDLARHPVESRLDKVEVGERVTHMRIEARRYHDQVGPEISEPRQDD